MIPITAWTWGQECARCGVRATNDNHLVATPAFDHDLALCARCLTADERQRLAYATAAWDETVERAMAALGGDEDAIGALPDAARRALAAVREAVGSDELEACALQFADEIFRFARGIEGQPTKRELDDFIARLEEIEGGGPNV